MKPKTLDDLKEKLQFRSSGNKPDSWPVSFFRDLTKASPAKQLTVGGVSGWCVGFVFTKAGKVAATAIGGSLLLFQIAQHQGYVKVNWTRLNKDMQQAKNELARRANSKLPRIRRGRAQQFTPGQHPFLRHEAFRGRIPSVGSGLPPDLACLPRFSCARLL
uniref:Putative membrane protein n=1 Tax=Ixodes ricinus TaxID=34613 RepID=V5IJE9_IXORI